MSVLEAGQSFGRYTIINLEAAVGPIQSYRAYDSSIGRDVRLSVLASRDRAASDRFHAAMVALLDLAHPNILDIYDAGDIGGVLYLATPLMDGVTLAQRLTQGSLAPGEIGKIVEQVAAALQYAHEHGIADGAVTLDNILLDTRGNAVLSGFGAGALADGDAASARRRDIAMLGSVVLALLAGRALGEAGESASTLMQPYIERLPQSVQRAATERYQQLLDRAASADATRRFASVADFVAAWRQAAGTESSSPAAQPSKSAAVPVTSAADQIQAQRRADAAAQSQAREAGYNSQWLERVDAKKREAAEANARIQRETRERSNTLERARLERDSRIGAGTTVGAPAERTVDPAIRAALSRLMRTVQVVAEKRASTIGMRPLSMMQPTSRPPTPPAKPIGAPVRPAPAAVRPAIVPAAVAPRVARQASAVAAPVASRMRPMLAGVIFFLLVVFCVFPLSCIIWASTLPDETPTPEAPAARSTSTPALAPTRVPTSAARAPTATPLARASAVPTMAPLDAVVMFTDTFQSGACRLPEGTSSMGTQACTDGRLIMLPAPGTPMWSLYDGTRGDMIFEADARIITSTRSLEYGLVWAAGGDRFSGFSLASDGALNMFDYQTGKFTYTMQGLSFSAVNPGVSGNRLGVRVSGGRFAFAVNGREVPFTMSAGQAGRGTIGYFVQSREPGAGVAFSNAQVSEFRVPGGSSTAPAPQPTAVSTR